MSYLEDFKTKIGQIVFQFLLWTRILFLLEELIAGNQVFWL